MQRDYFILLQAVQMDCRTATHSMNLDRVAEEEMFKKLVKDLAEREGVNEKLKSENQMLWVQKMCNICNRATEIVNAELIYT